MAPKRKNSTTKVQTTLSKFFSSGAVGGVKETSQKSVSGNKVIVLTDADDDFQVAKTADANSSPCNADGDEGPACKKICTAKKSDRKGKGKEHTSCSGLQKLEKNSSTTGDSATSSSTSLGAENAVAGTSHTIASSNKLKEYEYTERTDGDASDHVFVPRCSKMISEIEEANGDVMEIDSNDSQDEESSQSPSCSYAAFKSQSQPSGRNSSQLSQYKKQTKQTSGEKIKYTPLEQQVVEIKQQHPNTVLFVECGYKYRFFGDDAEIAAKVLKIYCHMDHNFMTASIPVHRLFVHLRRIVAAGYKAGVVKQTETSSLKAAGDNKSGPFSRKLTALYTKATLIGEDVDPLSECEGYSSQSPASGHQLMCLCEDKTPGLSGLHLGLVCIDPSTGHVTYDDFSDNLTCSELETRIAHLQPVEVLISTQMSQHLDTFIRKMAALSATEEDRMRIETMDEENFIPTTAFNIVSEFYKNDQTSLQFVLKLPKPVISCLSALSVYLQDFQLDQILSITSNFTKFSERSCHLQLSSASTRCLELFQNSCDGAEKGSLYWVINHTCTRFGARLLRKWLSQPLLDIREIQSRQDAIEELMMKNMGNLNKFKETMAKLPDLERGLCSIFHRKCSFTEFCVVTRALERVRKEMSDLHLPVTSTLLTSLVLDIPEYLHDVNKYASQICEKAARENDRPNLFVDDSNFPVVRQRKEEIMAVEKSIHDHRKEIRLKLGQPGLNYVTVMQIEFLIEMKNSQLKSVPSDWTQISSTKAVSRFHSPLIVRQYRKLKELREQLVLDVGVAWQSFLEEFSLQFVRYKKAVTYLATLDCLMSLAVVAAQGDFCKPQLDTDTAHINIVQGRHPIIDALTQGQEQFVPNDTNLDASGTRVMVISGPNMGGKSSYIRQVALITILAQMGSFVPAESASLGVLDAIYIRMGAADEIFKGRSTFMVELQEAGEIMAQTSEKSLVILDELGRGTSTHDGVAIAHATLEHFITRCQCLVLFVSHFPMMSEFHQLYPTVVDNFHMAFLLADQDTDDDITSKDTITFLYHLTQGAADKSYGLNVARLAELPPTIVKAAARKSQELEKKITTRIMNRDDFISLCGSDEESIKSVMKEYSTKVS